MKKIAVLPVLLCAALLLNLLAIPARGMELDMTPIAQTEALESLPAQTGDAGEEQGGMFSSEKVEIPFGQVSILEGCRTIEGMKPLDGSERKLKSALAAFVYEKKTNTVIYSYNPDMKLSPGTLAKLVTALVVIEQCELDDVVNINSSNIARLPAGSQHVDLKNGETLTVEDLLHCLILHSANDAAVALAEHVSGNMQGFAVLMNERVKQMGCTATEFGNVHGLDNATSWTTARDMARIMTVASENETLAKLIKEPTYDVPATEKSEVRKLITQNYMTDNRTVAKYFNQYVTGGLASHTDASGSSIVCTAEYKGMELVLVVMGATREYNTEPGWEWQALYYGNFDEMVDLVEYVFATFKVNRILYDGQALYQFPVTNGESQVVGMPTVNLDSVLRADTQMDNLTLNFSTVGGRLTAPIEKEDMIATVEVWYRNSCLLEAELFAMSPVKAADDTGVSFLNESIGGNSISGFWGFLGTVAMLLVVAAAAYLGYNAYRRARRRVQRRRRRAERRRSW